MLTTSPPGGPACCLLAAFAATVLAPTRSEAFHVTSARAHTPIQTADGSNASPALADVIAFVNRSGWPVDLGRMCKAFNVSQSDCRFRQVAVDTSQDGLDNHGFNVPVEATDVSGYVVIFHLRPLIGEFYLASPEGELRAALYRAKGLDFTPIANDEARHAFESEVSFWRVNLIGLERRLPEGGRQRVLPQRGMEP